ncbi:MAG: hypothetical protein ACJ8J7_17270 [Sulfurifustaceae bacterium]
MALLRSIGSPVTIAPGATHYWHYWFGIGLDVGVALVTPNLLESNINVELDASDNGVVAVQSPGEGGPLIHYTVRIHNRGATPMLYNLNIGNLL